MNHLKKLLIPIAVISIIFSGCGKTEEVPEVVEEETTPVEITNIKSDSIKNELVYAGQVQPNETVNVTSKISGQVEKVNYDLGDYVNKGDILFTLDKKDLQDNIKTLQAQLGSLNANIKSAQTGLAQVDGSQSEATKLQKETAIENAKIALENAKLRLDDAKLAEENTKLNLDDAEKKYNDTKQLFDAGVVTKNDFDTAELAYTQAQNAYTQALNSNITAQNAYSQAQTALNEAQESYNIYVNKTINENKETAKNSVSSAVASKESIETQIRIAQETLQDTAVKAPISGIISNKNISASNMVSAQSAPFTIVDMSKVTVDVNVSEKIINLIKQGQSVDVIIPTISDKKITGVIKNISPAADNTSTFPVKIEIDNKDSVIKPGMFAEIHFIESQNSNTMVVPRNTVVEEMSGKYVYVIENDHAVKREVTTGIDNGEEIEILSGVSLGENVVTKGQSYLDDGTKVTIVTNDPNAKEKVLNSETSSGNEQTTAEEE